MLPARGPAMHQLTQAILLPGLIALALAASMFLATSPSTCERLLLITAALISAYAVITRAPEVALVLFLFAGEFKAAPLLAPLNETLDLTLLFGLLLLAAGVRIAFTTGLRDPGGALALVWVLLCCLSLASLLWTPSMDYGFNKSLNFITLSSLAFLGPVIIASAGRLHLSRYLASLLLFSVAYSASVLPGVIRAPSSLDFVFVPGSSYLGLGRVASVGVLILLTYVLPRGRVAAALSMVLLTVVGGALLASGGRGPVLAVGLALVVLVAACITLRSGRGLIVVTYVPMIIGLVAALAHLGLLPANTAYRFSLLAPDMVSQDTSESLSTRTRLDMWDSAWQAISSRPLSGVGSGGFAEWYSGKDVREYPHNVFLEVGSELGVFGILLLFLLLAIPLRTWFRSAQVRMPDEEILLRICVLGLLVAGWANAMVSGDLNDNRLAWMACGFVVAACRQPSRSQRKNQRSLFTGGAETH